MMWRACIAVAIALSVCATSAVAQTVEGRILDLIFTVKDLDGQSRDLQVKETSTEVRIQLAADVLFDFDKADIRQSAADALKQVAGRIKGQPNHGVRIEGHTDGKGADAYNRALSLRRADSVRQWLIIQEGLVSVRFMTQGFGKTHPVASNTRPDGSDNPEGRQKNRRVEVIIEKG